MKRALFALLVSCALSSCGSSGDATAVWTKVLKNCAASQFIGNKYLFFGVSSTVGPGSGWVMKQDSIGLLFLPNQPFQPPVDVSNFIVKNNVVQCQGDSSTDCDLGASLPFSVNANGISGDLAAQLRS